MYFPEFKLDKPSETKDVEFKQRLGKSTSSWMKIICGFANTDGGHLYIGIEDKSRQLCGMSVHEAEQQVDLLQSKMKVMLDPLIDFRVSYYSYTENQEEKWIVCVEIPVAKNRPVFMSVDKMATAFIRMEGKTVPATVDALRAMLISGTALAYDEAMTEVLFEKNDFKTLFKVYSQENDGLELSIGKLQSNGFMNEKGYLSRGALLFRDGCQDPITSVHLRAWQGMTKGENLLLDNKEIQGNLLSLRQDAIDFILRHSDTGFLKKGISGEEHSSYPILALREIITNAIAHRNYLMSGSEIGIDIFDDRIEILSPGSAYGGKVIRNSKDLLSFFPWRRNPVISNVFTMCHMMEKSRSGFEKVEASYFHQPEAKKPMISCDEYSFQVVLYNCNYISDKDALLEGKDGEMLAKILDFCSTPRSLSEISTYLSMSNSSYFRKKYISPLIDGNLLEMTGKPNDPRNRYVSKKQNRD